MARPLDHLAHRALRLSHWNRRRESKAQSLWQLLRQGHPPRFLGGKRWKSLTTQVFLRRFAPLGKPSGPKCLLACGSVAASVGAGPSPGPTGRDPLAPVATTVSRTLRPPVPARPHRVCCSQLGRLLFSPVPIATALPAEATMLQFLATAAYSSASRGPDTAPLSPTGHLRRHRVVACDASLFTVPPAHCTT